jgi:hypothetical protein
MPEFACRACGLEWGHEGDPTADEQTLAELLAVRHADLVRALGRGWRREAAVWQDDDVQWFVSGEPAQVALGVGGPSFVLARPLTGWGEERRSPHPEDHQEFAREDLVYFPDLVAQAADQVASRRRRSFRWCRSCRRVHPPEGFVPAEGLCRQCEESFPEPDA